MAPVVAPWALAVLALLAVLLAVFAARRLRGPSRAERITLGTLRALALLLVIACLLRPAVIVSRAVPQRNVLAILVDDSRSMRIADADSTRRVDAARKVFADSAALVRRLSERFALRFFRFSATATPLTDRASWTAAGTRTDLATSLEAVRQELADVPLAGVVVVSDGADNTASDLEPPLLGYRVRRVPLYTVGVGTERFARDIAVDRVSLPRSVLEGGAAVADVTLGVRGYDGVDVKLTVEADGRVVHQETTTLRDKREAVSVPLRIPPLPKGTHLIRVIATPLDGEAILENNEAQGVLRVRPGREKVLYLDGEPRPEFAFIRRAVAEDSALQLVALLRSAEGKYLRLGVDDSLDLSSGFPVRRAELFRYRAIVLGNIEAAFFSGDQLRMLADFVSQRGGGLLMLGGRGTLGEGGYAGTPVDEVLPFALRASGNDPVSPSSPFDRRPPGRSADAPTRRDTDRQPGAVGSAAAGDDGESARPATSRCHALAGGHAGRWWSRSTRLRHAALWPRHQRRAGPAGLMALADGSEGAAGRHGPCHLLAANTAGSARRSAGSGRGCHHSRTRRTRRGRDGAGTRGRRDVRGCQRCQRRGDGDAADRRAL
ncbi:MAG: VWA domain-containing protein [Gemmatimonadetes bacterium]|nr:VWA domain-containing protein [Gemmatimonadota bacterium]